VRRPRLQNPLMPQREVGEIGMEGGREERTALSFPSIAPLGPSAQPGRFCRLTIRRIFLKFVEILRVQYGPNLIIAKSTVYEFKKIKIREICKKLDIIVRLLVKKFFQIGIVWLVKI
jgi:hypothetical protein